jgi:L-asparaginase
VEDDKLGFIASDELNPQKSRILLSLALLKPHTPQQTQEMFYTY